jgi:hypothetical protein
MMTAGIMADNCGSEFFRSAIATDIESYFIPLKPEFPRDGKTLECPHCHHSAVYRREHLVYRRAASA